MRPTDQLVDNDVVDVSVDGEITGSRDLPLKRWGNRVGRRSGKGSMLGGSDGENDDSETQDVPMDTEEVTQSLETGRPSALLKRWGNRVCLEAHCRSYEKNRNAFVACGQRYCGRRRR